MLYLNYKENRSGGEICEGDEGEEWPNYEDEIIEWEPISISKTKVDWQSEQLDFSAKVGETVYLVVARYFDGGTFGQTCGYWKVMDITKSYNKAQEFQKKYYNIDKKDYSYPWIGYFSGLESIDIHSFTVIA